MENAEGSSISYIFQPKWKDRGVGRWKRCKYFFRCSGLFANAHHPFDWWLSTMRDSSCPRSSPSLKITEPTHIQVKLLHQWLLQELWNPSSTFLKHGEMGEKEDKWRKGTKKAKWSKGSLEACLTSALKAESCAPFCLNSMHTLQYSCGCPPQKNLKTRWRRENSCKCCDDYQQSCTHAPPHLEISFLSPKVNFSLFGEFHPSWASCC